MQNSFIEHVNLTVSDPKRTAAMLHDIFGWTIRWEGPSLGDGYTVHVGTDTHYLAVYSRGASKEGCKERDRFVMESCHEKGLPLVISLGGGYSPDIRDIVDAHCNTFRPAKDIWF